MWPDVTSSIRHPVSADVDSGSLSPAWRSSGTLDGDDIMTSPPRGSGPLPPRSGHVTSLSRQLLPVGDEEDAIRSSRTTSSSSDRRRRPVDGCSRSRDDATDIEPPPPPPASFPRLGHVTGSDFAAWYPATLRAFAAALERRRDMGVNTASRPDTFRPLFLEPPSDLPRRLTVDDAAQLVSRRPVRSADSLLLPTGPQSYLQRGISADELPPRVARDALGSARSEADDRRFPYGQVLFSDIRGARTIASHVGGLNASSATSLVTSLPDRRPRDLFPRRSSAGETNLSPHPRYHDHLYHHTCMQYTRRR